MAIKNPKTPRVTRKEKKVAKMYADKPTWAKEDAPGPIPGYKKGGVTKMKKYQPGGTATPVPGIKKKMQKGGSGKPSYDMRKAYDKKVQTDLINSVSKIPIDSDYVGPYSIKGTAGPVNETVSKVRDIINSPARPIPYQKNGGSTKKTYKTGGMVNANAKITAGKKATGKSGGITKAISKVAVKSASPKGKVGGTSKAPKDASPVKLAKAKMGGMKGKSC